MVSNPSSSHPIAHYPPVQCPNGFIVCQYYLKNGLPIQRAALTCLVSQWCAQEKVTTPTVPYYYPVVLLGSVGGYFGTTHKNQVRVLLMGSTKQWAVVVVKGAYINVHIYK